MLGLNASKGKNVVSEASASAQYRLDQINNFSVNFENRESYEAELESFITQGIHGQPDELQLFFHAGPWESTGGGGGGTWRNPYGRPDGDYVTDLALLRTTTATRLNADGYIVPVTGNEIRVDFVGQLPAGTGKQAINGHVLLEPAATNQCTDSIDFTDSTASDIFAGTANNTRLSGSTIVSNTPETVAPDGTYTATKFLSVDGQTNALVQWLNTTITQNSNNVFSIFAKKGVGDYINIRFNALDADASVYFNLANGTVGTNANTEFHSIEDYGHGWYRCTVVYNNSGSDVTGHVRVYVAEGDNDRALSSAVQGVNYCYIWGLQTETSSTIKYPTSYIPTSGAQVTRSADVVSGAQDSNYIDSDAGTMYLNMQARWNGTDNAALFLADASSVAHRVGFTVGEGSSVSITQNMFAGGPPTTTSAVGSKNTEDFFKIALRWDSSSCSMYFNGSSAVSDSSVTPPSNMDKVYLSQTGGTNPMYGRVRNISIFGIKLSNSEMAALTDNS